MMSIHLSPKHGVNPAIPKCFFCLKDKNEIILPGRLPGDAEAPRGAVWDKRPCDECAAWMAKGVILISVRPGSDPENPYRTGGWAVMTDDAVRRVFPETHVEAALRMRVAFIETAVWNHLGIEPRVEDPGGPS